MGLLDCLHCLALFEPVSVLLMFLGKPIISCDYDLLSYIPCHRSCDFGAVLCAVSCAVCLFLSNHSEFVTAVCFCAQEHIEAWRVVWDQPNWQQDKGCV